MKDNKKEVENITPKYINVFSLSVTLENHKNVNKLMSWPMVANWTRTLKPDCLVSTLSSLFNKTCGLGNMTIIMHQHLPKQMA